MRGLQALDSFPRRSRLTLLRRFTLLSLGTTLAVGVLFGTITARLVENFALRRQARATAAHVLELAGSRLAFQDFLSSESPPRTEFVRAMRDLVGRADIVHVTLWDRRGRILYSDDYQASRQTSPPQASLRLALDGQLQWRLLAAAGNTDPGTPVLEVFVPVLASGMPEPVAVYQVIATLSDLAPALARLIWSVQISVVLGVLILYAALFTIVRAASGDLNRKESALRWAFVGIIRSLVNALDARDMATAHHSTRVAERALAIARGMGLSETATNEVQVAAFLHDVGKIGIRDDLLTKQGPLTAEERATMQQHTVFGYDILDPVSIPDAIKLAVRHSHERWDGRGYPDGLAGERIPLAARIIAVADAYEALTTHRPYRPARSPQEATEEIRRNAGTQFDPHVVDAALRTWHQDAGEDVHVTSAKDATVAWGSAQSQRVGGASRL